MTVAAPRSAKEPGAQLLARTPARRVQGADTSSRTELRAAAVASGLLTVAGMVTALGNVAFHTVVARAGGASAYGATGALLSLAAVAGFLGAGIQYAVARTTSLSSADARTILWHSKVALVPWVLLSIILLAASGQVAGFMHLSSPLPVVLAVLYFMTMVAWTVPTGVLVGQRRFRVFALLALGAVAVRLGLGAPFAQVGDPTVGALLASLVAALWYAGASTVAALHGYVAENPPDHALAAIDEHASLAGEGVSSAVLAGMLWALWSLPLLFSRHALPSAKAGDFAAAQLLVSGILFATAPLTTAFFPAIASTRRGRTVVLGLTATVLVSLIGAIALAAFGPTILERFYGRQFTASAGEFAVLSCSATLIAVSTYGLWVVRALQRPVLPAACGIVAAIAGELLLGGFWQASPAALAAGPSIAAVWGGIVAWSVARLRSRYLTAERYLRVKGVAVPYRNAAPAVPSASSLLAQTAVGMMVHNEAASIERCARAILDERDGAHCVRSLVIVASGCTDGTESIASRLAAEDSRVRVLVEAARSGKAAAINWFLRETDEPICALIGGDTLLAPGALLQLVTKLRDPSVGMTGARVVPVDGGSGLVGRVVRLLWELHHEVALRAPKLGEAVAFKRVFESVDSTSLTDEVSIEALVRRTGQELRYVPDAIVYNHGPQALNDYLAQRSRIHLGHLGVRASTGYSASTLRIQPAAMAVSRTLLRHPLLAAHLAAAVILEMVARWRAELTFLVGGVRLGGGVWKPVESTKRPFSSTADLSISGIADAERVA